MQRGIFGVNMGAASHRDGARRLAEQAEALGYDSLWAGEHVVLPSPRVPPSPAEPTERMVDPVVALTFLAAHTERVLLGTGVIILPQRNPVVLAKELASLDVMSGGRLVFGVGVGYLEPEFAAIGAPFTDRGRRTVEFLAAMQALWEQEAPAFDGRFVRFSGVDAHPRPLQRPIPVVMGGHSPAAWRRTVVHAHGWYGFNLDLDQTRAQLEEYRRALDTVGRPAALGELEINVTPRGPVDDDTVAAFAAAGVHRLILLAPSRLDDEGLSAWLRAHAPGR